MPNAIYAIFIVSKDEPDAFLHLHIMVNPAVVTSFAEKCVTSAHEEPESCKLSATVGIVVNNSVNFIVVIAPVVLALALTDPLST
ncbi:hypothetical protein K040078D81_31330 [Blautia hominis]|uniref:Uncharacterized protein n=1 Tax=Blautia hominis TaxID=2025493 RepID=A0ABQ0BC33_9FIRM